MRHLRGLPGAIRLYLEVPWFIADLAREAISDRIHHRNRPWPS